MELKRRGVRDLICVIVAAKTLVEFKKERDSSRLRSKKNHHDSDSDGDRHKSPRRNEPIVFKDKGRHKKDGLSKKYSCFLCNGPH